MENKYKSISKPVLLYSKMFLGSLGSFFQYMYWWNEPWDRLDKNFFCIDHFSLIDGDSYWLFVHCYRCMQGRAFLYIGLHKRLTSPHLLLVNILGTCPYSNIQWINVSNYIQLFCKLTDDAAYIGTALYFIFSTASFQLPWRVRA